jgi:hypothetical protein
MQNCGTILLLLLVVVVVVVVVVVAAAAGCTTFAHLPALIKQLYYLPPPVLSVIPIFLH